MDEERFKAFSADLFEWFNKSRCSPPAPHFVKQACMLRHSCPEVTWVETGTYLGQSAAFLSQIASHVRTIEPSEECYARALNVLQDLDNVTMHKGFSEAIFPELLAKLSGGVCFWLDGHFSGGITTKSLLDTPIKSELREIGRNLHLYDRCVVLIDDIRECGSGDYPPLEYFVFWALRHGFNWTIEHDIFIAKSASLPLYP